MTEVKMLVESPDAATNLVLICEELRQAKKKHPNWPTDIVYMDAIVSEEKGEVTRAAVQYAMEGGSLQEVRHELIQTAAMCLRMLETLPMLDESGYDAEGLQ